MACTCGTVPAPREKHSYLIELLDAETHLWGRCIVQAECPCNIQERLQSMADRNGGFTVDRVGHGTVTGKFLMHQPRVMKIDAKAAAHVPLVDPV